LDSIKTATIVFPETPVAVKKAPAKK